MLSHIHLVETLCLGIITPLCRRANLQGSIEAGSGLGHEHLHTRPAAVLLPNWVPSKHVALDFTVVSSLVQPIFLKQVPQQGQLPSQQKEGSTKIMMQLPMSRFALGGGGTSSSSTPTSPKGTPCCGY